MVSQFLGPVLDEEGYAGGPEGLGAAGVDLAGSGGAWVVVAEGVLLSSSDTEGPAASVLMGAEGSAASLEDSWIIGTVHFPGVTFLIRSSIFIEMTRKVV